MISERARKMVLQTLDRGIEAHKDYISLYEKNHPEVVIDDEQALKELERIRDEFERT